MSSGKKTFPEDADPWGMSVLAEDEEISPSWRAAAGSAPFWAPTHLTGTHCPTDSRKFPFSFLLSVPCAKDWEFLPDGE